MSGRFRDPDDPVVTNDQLRKRTDEGQKGLSHTFFLEHYGYVSLVMTRVGQRVFYRNTTGEYVLFLSLPNTDSVADLVTRDKNLLLNVWNNLY